MDNSLEQLLIRANKKTLDDCIRFWTFHALSGAKMDHNKAMATYQKMFDAEETEFVFVQSSYALQKECNKPTNLILGKGNDTLTEYQEVLCVREMTAKVLELTDNIFNILQQEIEGEFTGRLHNTFGRFRGREREVERGDALIDIERENGIMEATYKEINFINFSSIIALDFLTKIGVVNDPSIDCLIELALSGVYGMVIYGCEKVIFMGLPKVSLIDRQISSSKGLAIEFPDNYGLAMWKNLRIPNKYVTEPITKQVIMSETNAEYKRCIKEMVGNEAFAQLLDLVCIHEDFDDRGNIMRLLRSKEKDSAIQINRWSDADDRADGHLYFLHVTCPSTLREYYLCVKPTRDVWDAKASLFQHKPIQVRHGDCGFLNLKKKFERPIAES